ncbi:hypothetical protein PPSIR1_25196 [Plesiocystis pacifica SIR-1]|uniref:Uncharacterized protein n=1 Tax=Plesiocystis pacifica SIR-1 TaxID=391625 RepID=A6GDY7_9BACT|nr:hypothetical protein [Plesiocystis pacifica]EDM75936.1 hypothetical protein PPSIR1_25196 [Plesiocystis pacifica SIR-1]
MSRKFTLSVAGLVAFALFTAPASASAEYRDLCDSSKVCEYTGPGAPVLDEDVCLDPTGEVRLKGSTTCGAGSVPFHVRFGEVVDPVLQLVVAYVPLENACSVEGLCSPKSYDDGTSGGTEQTICCINGVCWPVYDCGGTLLWCVDGVCNEDGTVTCFEYVEGE